MSGRMFNERDIHMALDGEMPTEDAAAFEAWLAENPEMNARKGRFEADRDRVRKAFSIVLDEPLPDRLVRAISGEPRPGGRTSFWRNIAAAAAILAVGGLAGYLAGSGNLLPGAWADDRIAEHAVAAHSVYAAERRHAVEVGADERDHLLGWLSKRTGVTLIAPDLAAQGFELVGGRLLPYGKQPAALLLYEDTADNRISVYVTGEAHDKVRGTYSAAAGGPSAIYWLDPGYGCAVVGSLPQDQLRDVARSAYRQLIEGAGVE